MIIEVGREDFTRYANHLVRSLRVDGQYVQDEADDIISKTGNGIHSSENALKWLERSSFVQAMSGRLDDLDHSLAEVFGVEDMVRSEFKLENPSIEKRLDLCILAATNFARELLRNTNSGIIIYSGTYIDDSLFTLHGAFKIQRLFFEEGGEQEAFDLGVTKTLAGYKNEKLGSSQNNSCPVEKSSSEFKRLGMSKDDAYSYFLREMLRSVKEGNIGDIIWDCLSKTEDILWLFEKQGFIFPVELTPRLVAYAHINNAKNRLAKKTNENDFHNPKVIKAPIIDRAVNALTRANAFMSARLLFLVDFNRITPDYDDVRKTLLSRVTGE